MPRLLICIIQAKIVLNTIIKKRPEQSGRFFLRLILCIFNNLVRTKIDAVYEPACT